MSDFVDWLNSALRDRAWSNNELARRTKFSSSNVSLVMTRQLSPSWEFCYKVAVALNEPPERVFRIAGLLPPMPERDPLIQESVDLLRQMSQNDKEEVVAYARYRYQRAQQQR